MTAALVVCAWVVILGAVLAVGWLVTGPLASVVEPWDDDVSRRIADQRTAGPEVWPTWAPSSGTPWSPCRSRRSPRWGSPSGSARSAPALFVALVVAGIGGFYSVATHLITRDRPPVRILDPGLVADHSFPSGHVATATAVFGGIAVLGWTYARSSRGSWWWLLLALPVLEILARLYEGAHHVTDVLTSVAYACAWLVTLTLLVLPDRRLHRSPGRRVSQ